MTAWQDDRATLGLQENSCWQQEPAERHKAHRCQPRVLMGLGNSGRGRDGVLLVVFAATMMDQQESTDGSQHQ